MSDRRTAAAVERWAKVHRGEFVRDLITLIRIPSVAAYGEGGAPMGTACREALECMQETARKFGLQTENHQDHCLSVVLPGKDEQRELGLIGHVDVVPAGSGWKYAPFEAVEKNGHVIGRGSADNKGPVLMALYALRCIQELGVRLNSSIRLIVGCDEEREMRDIRHFLAHREPPVFTLNCDGTWGVGIGEKGMMTAELCIPIQGDCLLDIGGGEAVNMVPAAAWAALRGADEPLRAAGRTTHCSTPSGGVNAIRLLLDALRRDERLTGEDAKAVAALAAVMKDDDGTALGIRYADSMSRTTCVGSLLTLRDRLLRLQIDVRFALTQPVELLVKRLTESCAGLGLAVQNLRIQSPRYISPEQPELRLLMETCHEFVAKRHRPYVSGGGTYSRLFPRSVPFGVIAADRPRHNDFGGPHAADEAVCIEELLQAMKVYVVALLRLDSFDQEKGKGPLNGE